MLGSTLVAAWRFDVADPVNAFETLNHRVPSGIVAKVLKWSTETELAVTP